MGAANNGSIIERKMPRKRWLTYYSVIKPEDGDEVDDYDLVRLR